MSTYINEKGQEIARRNNTKLLFEKTVFVGNPELYFVSSDFYTVVPEKGTVFKIRHEDKKYYIDAYVNGNVFTMASYSEFTEEDPDTHAVNALSRLVDLITGWDAYEIECDICHLPTKIGYRFLEESELVYTDDDHYIVKDYFVNTIF